jgi:endo-1,4-beta-xylanase
MRRILISLCVAAAMALIMAIPAFAENTVDVPKGRPVIDGKIDPVWSYAAAIELEHITIDSRLKDDDHAKASAKLLWDEQYIYCLVEVKDKAVSDLGSDWRQDSVEYFIDAQNTKSYALQGENNGQYRLGCSGSISGSGGYDEVTFRKNSSVKLTSDGYLEEVAIPLTSHKVTGKEGMKIGFDFQLNDDSNNDGDRDYIISWNEDGMAYENPSQLGTIVLAAPMPGAPVPEPIKIEAPAPVPPALACILLSVV